jgi:uncharacterized ion transporter superfamily protein YfcC
MPETMNEEEIYKQARKYVQDKKDFVTHLCIYIVVNTMLAIIWAITSRGYPWFIWPMLGWGVGLVFHGLSVFVFDRQGNWERSEVEKEAARLRGHK